MKKQINIMRKRVNKKLILKNVKNFYKISHFSKKRSISGN